MRAKDLKIALALTVSTSALLGLGINSASAGPLPFTIDPSSVGSTQTGFVATDIQGSSFALIRQDLVIPGLQHEVGFLKITSFQNGPALIEGNDVRLNIDWDFYITFATDVTGLTFTPGLTGTITSFEYTMWADVGNNDTFTGATANSGGGIAPVVGGTTGDDKVIGVGHLVSGTAGFQSDGAPIFSVIANFLLCNGTANKGDLGSVLNQTATGCQAGFNAHNFFTTPNPFYSIDLAGVTGGSGANVSAFVVGSPAGVNPNNLALNGLVGDVNFTTIPEPASMAFLGAGFLGLGFMFRRRNSRAVNA